MNRVLERGMQKTMPLLIANVFFFACAISACAQNPSNGLKTGILMKREMRNGTDNYPYAAYSFKFGGNGPEIQKLCRNNWELLFGNSPEADSFDVTMVTDDRSRIRDLGPHGWADSFVVPNLIEHEKPQREPSVKAIEGHVYVVHARDTDTDLYALFRVEKLVPGERVEITWKLIPTPPPSKIIPGKPLRPQL